MAGNATSSDGVKESLRIAKLVGYTLIFAAGLLLNVLLLFAVTRKRLRHKNTSKTFIIMMQNLAVTDILLLITTIPFDTAWHEVEEFPYGAWMCRFLWPFQTACLHVVVFTYVLLSFHRTYGVKTRLFGQVKSFYGCVVVICIWAASIASVIPYMVFLKHTPGDVSSCDEDWELAGHRKTYTVFLFLVQYLIPLLVMTVLYVITLRELKSYRYRQDSLISQRRDRHSRVNLMLVLYLAVFAVLLLPHQIMWFMLDFGNGKNEPHFDDVLNFLYVFTYAITVTNVVFFFMFNDEFKSDMWFFLRCYFIRGRPSPIDGDSRSFSVEENGPHDDSNGRVAMEMENRPTDALKKDAQYAPSSSLEV